MKAFTSHHGIAAPLRLDDVNTDVIIPTARAIHVAKGSLGRYAFEPLRHDAQGLENKEFVFNQDRYRNASIIVAGANFGCGSSREMAVWALDDMGIRCVIAPSFGDIFFQNCCKIGLLPISLAPEMVDAIWTELSGNHDPVLTVDLETCEVRLPSGAVHRFAFDDARRDTFLNGLDDIGQTLRYSNAIAAFVEKDRRLRPWNYLAPAPDHAAAPHQTETSHR